MSVLKVKSGNQWVGVPSIQGEKGDPGAGVPNGGSTGQVLAKHSNTNQDTEWINPPAGGVLSGETTGYSSNTFTATVPGLTELKDGATCWITINSAWSSSSTVISLNVNNLGAKVIKWASGSSVSRSQVYQYFRYLFAYSSSGSGYWTLYSPPVQPDWNLLNGASAYIPASQFQAWLQAPDGGGGIIELHTGTNDGVLNDIPLWVTEPCNSGWFEMLDYQDTPMTGKHWQPHYIYLWNPEDGEYIDNPPSYGDSFTLYSHMFEDGYFEFQFVFDSEAEAYNYTRYFRTLESGGVLCGTFEGASTSGGYSLLTATVTDLISPITDGTMISLSRSSDLSLTDGSIKLNVNSIGAVPVYLSSNNTSNKYARTNDVKKAGTYLFLYSNSAWILLNAPVIWQGASLHDVYNDWDRAPNLKMLYNTAPDGEYGTEELQVTTHSGYSSYGYIENYGLYDAYHQPRWYTIDQTWSNYSVDYTIPSPIYLWPGEGATSASGTLYSQMFYNGYYEFQYTYHDSPDSFYSITWYFHPILPASGVSF